MGVKESCLGSAGGRLGVPLGGRGSPVGQQHTGSSVQELPIQPGTDLELLETFVLGGGHSGGALGRALRGPLSGGAQGGRSGCFR